MKIILSTRNRQSKVWLDDGFIYKSQPKYLTDNEIWCLKRMEKYGVVPKAEQIEIELIKMEFIEPQPITNETTFLFHCNVFLHRLEKESIRHGDLTTPHILTLRNRPYIIDWAESRHWHDPRPDKRPEGDAHWFNKTIKEMTNGRAGTITY
jgi:tRNA A-37 threonylcarbamoyl transferase component Bud32